MKNNKMRMIIVPLIYVLAISSFLASIYFLQKSLTSNDKGKDQNDDSIIVNNDDDNSLPVSKNEELFSKPFMDTNVTMSLSFYNNLGESADQLNSIIVTASNNVTTYSQSNGVVYSSENQFNVLASLSGTVTTVKENDPTFGTIVVLKHDNGLETIYAGLSSIVVKEGDTVTQGAQLGSSGKSIQFPDYKNMLFFELRSDKGFYLDPEKNYDVKISEVQ